MTRETEMGGEAPARAAPPLDVTVVGPAMNEAGNLEEYVERCRSAFAAENVAGEIVIVDDGSTDGSDEILQGLVDRHPGLVRGFRHRRNLGLTQALKTGFANARGEIVLWISTDLESHPDEDIPIFLDGFRDGADVVAGYRRGRGDGKVLASTLYNAVSNWLFGMSLKDMNWMKGFRRVCLDTLELRGDWHRFILMMLHKAGYRIVEKEMRWHPRRYGRSKFGVLRFPRALVDAVSIWFLLAFSRKPMRLFGSIGIFAGVLGVLIHLGLALYYLLESTQIRPLFWTALVLELMGLQLVLFGFVTELIERVRDDVDSVRRHLGQTRQWWVEVRPRRESDGADGPA